MMETKHLEGENGGFINNMYILGRDFSLEQEAFYHDSTPLKKILFSLNRV